MSTIGSLGYKEKLGEYGFNERLYSSNEQCEDWLEFCKKNNMVWLGGSYGTLAHKDLSNHFIWCGGRHDMSDVQIKLGTMDNNYHYLVDMNHANIIQSKINGCYIITSSPNYIDWTIVKNYPYQVFIIHPSLLEDYSLGGINLAFTDMTWEEMDEINNAIYEDIGIYKAFRHLAGAYKR